MMNDLVTEVIKAVAAADGVEPGELEMLHDYVDPDILLKLGAEKEGEWQFTFRYADHQVTVTHDSQILVDGVAHTPDRSMRR
jgi:hypothetical protein